jgi:hypothetical protein
MAVHRAESELRIDSARGRRRSVQGYQEGFARKGECAFTKYHNG